MGTTLLVWLENSYVQRGHAQMIPKSTSTLVSMLLIAGGTVFLALGAVHAIYTFLDLHNPQRLVPSDPSVASAMANSSLKLSGGATDMWRAWIGFNFSHSIGVLLVGALGIWCGSRPHLFPSFVVLALAVVGCVYVVLAVRYWFSIPAIGVGIGTACFAAAWVRSLF